MYVVSPRKTVAIAVIAISVFHNCSIASAESLPRSTPEAVGVSSAGVRGFLDAVAGSAHEMHSVMLVRHGRVVAEGWWAPYAADLTHTMYSTSKSFTATAIGIAAGEGLLTVEDSVVSFFPDKVPDPMPPHLRALKVKNLLWMRVGQEPDPTRTIAAGDDWVTAFLATPIVNEPGSRFLYNSAATYMLSAIVTKVSSETVLDYLTPRLFGPLGVSGIDWETDRPGGVNTGGWGLRLHTEDMAKFGQLFLQDGVWAERLALGVLLSEVAVPARRVSRGRGVWAVHRGDAGEGRGGGNHVDDQQHAGDTRSRVGPSAARDA